MEIGKALSLLAFYMLLASIPTMLFWVFWRGWPPANIYSPTSGLFPLGKQTITKIGSGTTWVSIQLSGWCQLEFWVTAEQAQTLRVGQTLRRIRFVPRQEFDSFTLISWK